MSFQYRLGRLHPMPSRKRVWLHQIVSADLPDPGKFDNRGTLTDWGMDGNDTVGDCTIAGLEHAVKCWRQMKGSPDTGGITAQQVLDLYSTYTGYNPADPSTDQGANEQDVLTKAQQLGFFDRKIQGFAAIGVNATPHLNWAGANLGGLYIGIALPKSIEAHMDDPTVVWDVADGSLSGDSAPGSLGGHCVWVVASDSTGFWFVSWGRIYKMMWWFWQTYVDEVWCLIPDSGDFFTPYGVAPDHLSEATLAQLMQEL